MRRDVVMILTGDGMFVASYAAREIDFPAGMDEFHHVLATLSLPGVEQRALGDAQLVPYFPALTLIPSRTEKTSKPESSAHPGRGMAPAILRLWYGSSAADEGTPL